MKITHFLFALAAISLTACSTTNRTHHGSAKTAPETVLVTYYVQSGKEAEFQAVLSRAWQIYRTEHLVYAKPHIIVRDTEGGDKVRFVEIFTWVNHAALEHAPDSMKTIWQQEHSLCEARSGHSGIEGGEVEIIIGRWPSNARWP
ncbi:MAG: hypothetical protein ABSD57_09460 [Verrucomicrobiota bacterium]|jgi:antibiotic biosynthesis monooxygenase (ABM) superfamily enzyme